MQGLVKGRAIKAGLPPGTLVHIGEKKRESTAITVIEYNEQHVEKKEIKTDSEFSFTKNPECVNWINVEGIHEVDVLERFGEHFRLHSLVMEDVVNTNQRPKIEDYDDYLYIVARMLFFDTKHNKVITEQVSLVLGDGIVISFLEKEMGVFDSVRGQIKNNIGHIRKAKADYLAYLLLDAIVDSYFITLEKLGEKIEYIEDSLVVKTTQKTMQSIHTLRRGMLFIHKAVWPLREVVGFLERGETKLIDSTTLLYLRDVYDHVIQVMDTTETYRDIISGMLDIYLSSISNRMNEVMKVLTIISTIFIPLTFIVGLYGMNFKYMPELQSPLGYPIVWVVMILSVITMILYFKKKKWM